MATAKKATKAPAKTNKIKSDRFRVKSVTFWWVRQEKLLEEPSP